MTSSHIKTIGISFATALVGLLVGFTYKKPSLSFEASLKPYSRMMSQETQVATDLKEMKQQLVGIENAMNAILKIHEDQLLNSDIAPPSQELEKTLPSEQKLSIPSHISTFENLE